MKKYILFFSLIQSACTLAQVWSEQTSGVSIPLTCASAIDVLPGWICGFNGTVLRTTNQGQNWLNVSGNGIPTICQLITIWGIDQNTALTAGNISSTTYLFRTTNGGASWTQVLMQDNGVFDAVWFTNSTNGFLQGDAVGGRWSLWKTTNGGVSWDSTGLYLAQSGSEFGWSNSFYMGSNNIWFGTDNSRIYYSSTSGTSWSIQPSPELVIRSLTLITSSPPYLGFGVGGGLIKTTTSGANWFSITNVGSGFYVSMASVVFWPSIWLARGPNIYTSVGNSNWATEYTAPSGNYRHISQIRVAITSIWAVRDNGGISRRYFNPTGIELISGEVPERFLLQQNYPNPFNASSKLKFGVSSKVKRQTSNVKIAVYDILGKEVAVLVNETLNPGIYEVEFDGTNFPSGVYFYRLVTDGFLETRKMLMIK